MPRLPPSLRPIRIVSAMMLMPGVNWHRFQKVQQLVRTDPGASLHEGPTDKQLGRRPAAKGLDADGRPDPPQRPDAGAFEIMLVGHLVLPPDRRTLSHRPFTVERRGTICACSHSWRRCSSW